MHLFDFILLICIFIRLVHTNELVKSKRWLNTWQTLLGPMCLCLSEEWLVTVISFKLLCSSWVIWTPGINWSSPGFTMPQDDIILLTSVLSQRAGMEEVGESRRRSKLFTVPQAGDYRLNLACEGVALFFRFF